MNVLILHGYSDSNKGDLAIVVGMVHGIRKTRPHSRITLQSVYSNADPEFEFHHRFMKKMGVSIHQMAVPSPYIDTVGHSVFRNFSAVRNLLSSVMAEWLAINTPFLAGLFPNQAVAIKAMKESDIIFLKGGQYIYNDQRGIRALLYLWRILHPIYVARRLGKDIAMLGQSVGPLVDQRGKEMTGKALSFCKRLVVREKKSQALMSELGLEQRTLLAPDLAFLINPSRPDSFNATATSIETNKWLGVTVVNWTFPDHADPEEKRKEYLAALTEIARRIHAQTGLKIALFPQVTVQHHGESDLDLLRKFSSQLTRLEIPHLLVTDDLSPEELSYLYGKCEVLLGTRLHSCILAACASTPVVAIRYQGFKTEGVMAELGLQDHVFDISSVDVDGIERSILIAIEKRAAISQSVRTKVDGFRSNLLKVLDDLLPKL